MDFLKKKLRDSQERQKNVLFEAGQLYPNDTIVAALERAFQDGSAMAITKPLQKQFQTERERPMTARRKKVLVTPRLLNLLSSTPSEDSPLMINVPSRILISVVTSSPVSTLNVQSPQAPPIGSPGALPFELDLREDAQFAQVMRITSRMSVVTTASVTAAAITTETMGREPSKQPSDASIPLEAKEPQRRCPPRKEQTKSGRSYDEKELHTRRRDDSDSNGEGEGKANDIKWSRSRNGNGTGKHGSNGQFTKRHNEIAKPEMTPVLFNRDGSESPNGQISCSTRSSNSGDGERTWNGVSLAYPNVGI